MKQNQTRKIQIISLLALFVFVGCGGDSQTEKSDQTPTPSGKETSETSPKTDTAQRDTDQNGSGDVENVGEVDDKPNRDEVQQMLIDNWPLVEKKAQNKVDVTSEQGTYSGTVNARAGGMQNTSNNPFVYVDLDNGSQISITDFKSFENEEWDLAFRRIAIRTNSADSGPGQISVAKKSGTDFSSVTSAPSDGYEVDNSVVDGELQTDPLNKPLTAFNYVNQASAPRTQSWYQYGGQGGGHAVSPVEGDIYIIKNEANSSTYKLQIQGWSDGKYTLRWAPINSE